MEDTMEKYQIHRITLHNKKKRSSSKYNILFSHDVHCVSFDFYRDIE